jgi:hypothetical protein
MPDTTIPFYALRLSHLVAAKAQLVVTCGACRKERVAEVLPIYHRLGPMYGVRDLEKRLTCGQCGRRGWASVRVEWF